MQAIFLISLFSMLVAVVTSIISSGSSNSTTLTQQRVAETKDMFQQIAKVSLDDVTLSQMQGNPNNDATPADYIRNSSKFRSLSSGRYADAALDPWGSPYQGFIVTQYQTISTNDDNKVSVPVTGIVLVSPGPDRKLQTTIPTGVTNISAIYGVSAPVGASGITNSDDIIYSFDNSDMQRQLLETIKSHVERIGSAALRELQQRTDAYRQTMLTQYQADIAAGKSVDATSLDISKDPNAPKFMALDNSTQGLLNRRKLGVDDDFNFIERVMPNGGNLVLNAPAPATPADPLVITVTNNPSRPTPWGSPSSSLKFLLSVQPKISS